MKLFKKNNNREEIIERMRLPEEIRNLSIDEQKKFIVSFISELLESGILENEDYIENISNYH